MIVLRFSMPSKAIFQSTIASVMCLHFSMREEDILQYTNGKYHLCTLWSTCRPLCSIDMHLITLFEHTHAKILVSTLDCQVS